MTGWRRHGDPGKARQAKLGAAADQHPPARQPVAHRLIVGAQLDQHEVGLGGVTAKPRRGQLGGQHIAGLGHLGPAGFDESGRSHRRPPGCQGDSIDVERLLHDVHQPGHLRIGDGVAKAQAGQPEDLRERPHHHHRPAVHHVLQPGRTQARIGEVHVRLVGHHHAVAGQPIQETRATRRRPSACRWDCWDRTATPGERGLTGRHGRPRPDRSPAPPVRPASRRRRRRPTPGHTDRRSVWESQPVCRGR